MLQLCEGREEPERKTRRGSQRASEQARMLAWFAPKKRGKLVKPEHQRLWRGGESYVL
jgi:hypothetical protein